jgi:hypothetical protein
MNDNFKNFVLLLALLYNFQVIGQNDKRTNKTDDEKNKIEIKRLEQRIKVQQIGSNIGAGLAVVGILPVLGIEAFKKEIDPGKIQTANTFQYIGLGVFATGVLIYALEQKGISVKQQKINRLGRMNFNLKNNSVVFTFNF